MKNVEQKKQQGESQLALTSGANGMTKEETTHAYFADYVHVHVYLLVRI